MNRTINLGEHDKLLERLSVKKGLNRTAVIKIALEALEEKEAARDRELNR